MKSVRHTGSRARRHPTRADAAPLNYKDYGQEPHTPQSGAAGQSPDRRPSTKFVSLAAHACLVAKDAAYNLREFVSTSSRMAILIVRQCERELDQIERNIDQQMPEAMIRVGERTARELLAAVRFITDLERIGDLLCWAAERPVLPKLAEEDKTAIEQMLTVLEHMLDEVHHGLLQRELQFATSVLRQDQHLDRLRREAFHRHLQGNRRRSRTESVEALFIVQSIERAGDHATNLAEELVHLIAHRSIRHAKPRPIEG